MGLSRVLASALNGLAAIATSGSAADLSGTLAKARLPAGSVLQVVQAQLPGVFSFGSSGTGNFVNITGLSASITPLSSTSKILVVGNVTGGPNTQSYYMCYLRLTRNGSVIGNSTDRSGYTSTIVGGLRNAQDTNSSWMASFSYLDSPATTSAVTYQIQISGEGGTMYVNTNGSNAGAQGYSYSSTSSILLMEVAA